MNIKEIISMAMTATGLSQNGLAKAIGLTPSNLSSVMAGRRPLPATAAIKLWKITGIDPETIEKEGRRDYKSGLVARIATVATIAVISMTTLVPEAKANMLSTFRHFPFSALRRLMWNQRLRLCFG